jgi:hypothetical protein
VGRDERRGKAARDKRAADSVKPLKLEALLFYKLKAALTQRLLVQQQAQRRMAEADTTVAALLKDANLEPTGIYDLDEANLTIAKVR